MTVGQKMPPAVYAPPGAVLGTVYFGRAGWPRKWRIAQGIATVSLTLAALSRQLERASPSSSPLPLRHRLKSQPQR